ncbi:carbohydrate sulfotransferase 15-like [Haliotis rufescens]|uniref:carbohydrate sulfotransferase 15-like n=1 Tax=Haliotis rufescens TaxID=6454 RepID=UPI00201E7AB8|nr:carbohydrate sulfotransferase 15-like [Haliotis rufescens]
MGRNCVVGTILLLTVARLTSMYLNIHHGTCVSSINNLRWINNPKVTDLYNTHVQTHTADGSETEYLEDSHDAQRSKTDEACPWNNMSPPLDDNTKKKYKIHDLFRVKKPAFLSDYKNPCWRKSNTRRLVCLPYFYLVGFPKCGSTFTFSTIVAHPEVAKPKKKETHWLARGRYNVNSNLNRFLGMFSTVAKVIEENVIADSHTDRTFHPLITGDGSPSTVWNNPNWRYLPGNYNCTEPRVLTPHYIHHLNPSTNIIIVIRNPTDMRISDYNYFYKGHITAESFHDKVVDDLRMFKDCCSKFPMRTCAYNSSFKERMLIGLYHVFISDWMKVFPRDHILIARLEDMRDDPYASYSKIFEFLGLSQVSRSELHQILSKSNMNQSRKRFQVKNETRRLLEDFFRPHNIELAKLMKNTIPIYI